MTRDDYFKRFRSSKSNLLDLYFGALAIDKYILSWETQDSLELSSFIQWNLNLRFEGTWNS